MNRPWHDLLYPEGMATSDGKEASPLKDGSKQTGIGGLSDGFRSDFWLRGYRMIEQMTGEISFVQGVILALSGRMINRNEDRLLNGMFINNGIADARFWLFRTARLAATVKSPPSACLSAGLLVNDGSFLASGAAYHTSSFFYKTRKRMVQGQESLQQIVQERLDQGEIIGGFGRVLARGPDERNPALLQLAKECQLADGPYLKQAFEIESLLQELKDDRLHMNSAGLGNALLLDMHLTPQEIMLFASFMFMIGMSGNILEAYERPPGEFLALTDDDINYIGPKRRRPPGDEQRHQHMVKEIDGIRVIAMDSVSYLVPENRGDIVICGSHGALAAARYARNYSPLAIIFSDAGKGKEDAGTSGLSLLDKNDIIALAVSVDSARIGDAMDTFQNGIISSANQTAFTLGLKSSMKVTEVVDIILRDTNKESAT
jgi:Citrate synthase, C-terminal domain